jgi:hypothetical protein
MASFEATEKGFFASVDSQVRFQIKIKGEFLAA